MCLCRLIRLIVSWGATPSRSGFPVPEKRARPGEDCPPPATLLLIFRIPDLDRSLVLRLLTILVLLCSFWTPGALLAGTAARTSAAHQGQVSDSQLQQTIQTKLAKSKIGKDGFRFHVSHGIVTWEGSTNVVQHKGAATRMARSAGAASVVNNIQVSAAAKAKAAKSLKRAAVAEN
jgi:hypothetical protein